MAVISAAGRTCCGRKRPASPVFLFSLTAYAAAGETSRAMRLALLIAALFTCRSSGIRVAAYGFVWVAGLAGFPDTEFTDWTRKNLTD
jgi:predicted cobalt transporter CbtA